jgi:hypothetical protein
MTMHLIISCKGKVLLVPKHYVIMMYGEVEVKLHTFLTFALDGMSDQFHTPAVLSLRIKLLVLIGCQTG